MPQTKGLEFIIADINGRFDHILRKTSYNALTHCRSFEELVIKLNPHFPTINEDMPFTINELRARLYQNILDELGEFREQRLVVLEYFIEYNKILAFFNTLETGTETFMMGYTDELRGMAACVSFKEIERLYIRGSFLERYFEGVGTNDKLDENDWQRIACHVLKNYFDFYARLRIAGYFKEILEVEGDRQIFEICLNGRSLRNRQLFFPAASTLSERAKKKLGECESIDDTTEILHPSGSDPIGFIIERQMRVYAEAFKQYNDLACVYAYFRLKEQEMSNILWIAECIVQNSFDRIEEFITFE